MRLKNTARFVISCKWPWMTLNDLPSHRLTSWRPKSDKKCKAVMGMKKKRMNGTAIIVAMNYELSFLSSWFSLSAFHCSWKPWCNQLLLTSLWHEIASSAQLVCRQITAGYNAMLYKAAYCRLAWLWPYYAVYMYDCRTDGQTDGRTDGHGAVVGAYSRGNAHWRLPREAGFPSNATYPTNARNAMNVN